jgi:hypothetical protein
MNKTKQKKDYSAPSCIIVRVSEATNLLDASFPSQHNPAQPGGTISSAKQAPAWQEVSEENSENFSGWEN